MLIPRGLQLVLFCSPDCKSLILVSGIETLNHHNIIMLCVPHDANSVASEKQPLKGVLIRKKLLNPKSTKPKHVLGSCLPSSMAFFTDLKPSRAASFICVSVCLFGPEMQQKQHKL